MCSDSGPVVQGTRLYRDPFGENLLSSAFDNNKQLAQSIQLELPKLEGPLWWMSRDMDGTHVVHATLTEPSAQPDALPPPPRVPRSMAVLPITAAISAPKAHSRADSLAQVASSEPW